MFGGSMAGPSMEAVDRDLVDICELKPLLVG